MNKQAMLSVVATMLVVGCASETTTNPSSEPTRASASLALSLADGAASPTGEYTGDHVVQVAGTPDEVAARVAETTASLENVSAPGGLVRATLSVGAEKKEFYVAMPAASQLEGIVGAFGRPLESAANGAEHVGRTSSAITKNQCQSDTCGGTWSDWCIFGFEGSCGWACIVCRGGCSSDCGGAYASY